MSGQSELAHLFRALKAPAAARALPKLADRAREEGWSYERFAEVLLSTELSAREAHGGEARIRAARFPARKTLEEFDFSFQAISAALAGGGWPRSLSLSRYESPFRLRISAWWTSRSIIAAATTSSPKVSPQREKGLFEVTIIEARS